MQGPKIQKTSPPTLPHPQNRLFGALQGLGRYLQVPGNGAGDPCFWGLGTLVTESEERASVLGEANILIWGGVRGGEPKPICWFVGFSLPLPIPKMVPKSSVDVQVWCKNLPNLMPKSCECVGLLQKCVANLAKILRTHAGFLMQTRTQHDAKLLGGCAGLLHKLALLETGVLIFSLW